MFDNLKSFGKYLVTPQPQTPLTIGFNITLAALAVANMVMEYKELHQIDKEDEDDISIFTH